jgi:hypothetical protein
MTLEEAIKRLTDRNTENWDGNCDKDAEADALGIQALKRIKKCRQGDPQQIDNLLPGETEDPQKGG